MNEEKDRIYKLLAKNNDVIREACMTYGTSFPIDNNDLRSKIKDELIYKLNKIEMNILALNEYDIKINKDKIRNNLDELKLYYKNFKEYINILGYESLFIKKHIEKYEAFFISKLK